ncbi:MAG TPA: lysophospholipid acyltransferase family protein [Candidatus Dormibacteraeota bacterium]|nr:lysophospholipid acyltransferase family protein [Candidatus Dormibacteraeota bacterium]
MTSPPHRPPDTARRVRDGLRWLAEDTARMLREWRPLEYPEVTEPPGRAALQHRFPEPTWGRHDVARAVRRQVQRRALFPLLTAVGRPETVGAHNLVPLRPPLILAPNHASHSDAPIVLQALPEHIRERTLVPAAADYFFDRRWLSVLVTLSMNAVPFDRRQAIADSVRRCERFLRHGYSIVLFPEGTRSTDGRLRGFKAGVAHLAVQTGAPVVPVYVQGTHRLLPRGKALPRPSAVCVHFGEPLRAGAEESARQFNARLEDAVIALADTARGFAHRDVRPPRPSWQVAWAASERTARARRGAAAPVPVPALAAGEGTATWIESWRSTTPR